MRSQTKQGLRCEIVMCRQKIEQSITKVNWKKNLIFLDFVCCLIFYRSMTYPKSAPFLSSDKEVPNLVDSLDQAILSHWAPQKQ